MLRLLDSQVNPKETIKTTDNPDDLKQSVFVAAFIANKGNVQKACQEVSISHATYKRWKDDPIFQAKMDFGKETWISTLRQKAYEIAVSGDKEMIKYLLNAYAPEEFDSGIKKQILQNKGQRDLMAEMTTTLTQEQAMEALKNDPIVDYSDPEFWDGIKEH